MKPGKQAGAPSSLHSGYHHDSHAQERELREEEARRNGAIEKLDDILSKEHSTFVQIRYSCSAIKTLVQSAMTTGFPNSEVPSLREHVSNIRHMLRLLAQFSEEKDAFDQSLLLEAFTKRRERLARSKATSSSSSSSDPLGDDEPIPPRRRRKRAPSNIDTEPNTTITTTTTSSPNPPPYSSSSSPFQSPNSVPISPHPSTFSSIPPLPPELLSRSSDPSILMPPPPLPPLSHSPASPVPISPLSPHPPSPHSYLTGSPRSSLQFRPPSPHPSLSPHSIPPISPHPISPHPHSPRYTNFESHLGANSSIIHMSNPNIPKSSNYNSLQYTPSVSNKNTNKNPNLPPYNTYSDINYNPHTFVSHQNPPSSSSTFSSRKNRETPYARGYATIVHKAIQAEHEKDSENVKLEKEKQSEKRPKTTNPPSSPVSSITPPSSLSLSSQPRSISPNPSAFSPSSFRQYPTIPNIQIPNEQDQPSDTPYNKNIHNIFSKKETGSNKRRKERERQAMLQLNVQSYIDFTNTQVITNTPNTTTSTTTTTTNTATNDTSQKKSQKKEEKKMSISNLID